MMETLRSFLVLNETCMIFLIIFRIVGVGVLLLPKKKRSEYRGKVETKFGSCTFSTTTTTFKGDDDGISQQTKRTHKKRTMIPEF